MAKFNLATIFLSILFINQTLLYAQKTNLKVIDNIEVTSNYENKLLLKESFKKTSASIFYEENDSEQPESEISSKSPWLAFFLSFFLPTTGQLYNGDYTKALIQAALILTGGGLVVGTACVECGEYTGIQTGLFAGGALLAFSGYLWSIVDAPVAANAHNARIRKTGGISLYSTENNKYSIRLNKTPITKSYNLSLFVEL